MKYTPEEKAQYLKKQEDKIRKRQWDKDVTYDFFYGGGLTLMGVVAILVPVVFAPIAAYAYRSGIDRSIKDGFIWYTVGFFAFGFACCAPAIYRQIRSGWHNFWVNRAIKKDIKLNHDRESC